MKKQSNWSSVVLSKWRGFKHRRLPSIIFSLLSNISCHREQIDFYKPSVSGDIVQKKIQFYDFSWQGKIKYSSYTCFHLSVIGFKIYLCRGSNKSPASPGVCLPQVFSQSMWTRRTLHSDLDRLPLQLLRQRLQRRHLPQLWVLLPKVGSLRPSFKISAVSQDITKTRLWVLLPENSPRHLSLTLERKM